MPYGQWKNLPLSAVVKGVRSGCIEAIGELPNRLLHEYSPEIVDSLLFHMKTRLLKTHWSEVDLAIWRNTDLCLLALKSISHIWDICPPSHIEATAEQISSRMGDIVYTAFCVMRRVKDPKNSEINFDSHVLARDIEATSWISTVFEYLGTMHEPLSKSMFQLDDVLELCLLLWVATIDGDPFIYPNGPNDFYMIAGIVDAVTSLFKSALEANGPGVAAAVLRGNVCTPDAFAQATTRRMESWLNLNTLKHLQGVQQKTHVDAPIAYGVHIVEMLMRAHPAIFRLMIERRVPEVFMRILVQLDTRNCVDYQNHLEPCAAKLTALSMDVLDLAMVVIRWTEDSSFQHAIASAKRLMRDDCVVQLLRNCVTRRIPMAENLVGKEAKVVHDMFQILLRFSIYPKTGLAYFILCAKVHEPSSRFHHHRPGMEDLRKVVFEFATSVRARTPKDLGRGRIKLCDNLEHKHIDNADGSIVLQQTCARCHSVVYCSVECQAQDWRARHSSECHAMHMDYLERKHSATWYSHDARGYHLTVLRHVYANEVAKLEHPLPGEFVVKLDVADVAKPFSLEALGCYIDSTNGFLDAWKRDRFKHLIEEAESLRLCDKEVVFDRLNIVDGVFWFGDQELHLVVLFSRKQGAQPPVMASDLVVKGSLAYTLPRKIRSKPQYPDRNLSHSELSCIAEGDCHDC